jgi:DNA-binding PadR family transcriptional regulator
MMIRTDRLPSWPGRLGVLVALAMLAAAVVGATAPRLVAAAGLQGWLVALLAVALRQAATAADGEASGGSSEFPRSSRFPRAADRARPARLRRYTRRRILAYKYTAASGGPMAARRKVGNLLGLAILAVLAPGRPMHPYEMANVLRRTGKERDMRIKWGSLYTVVRNLEKHGFVEATGSDRQGRRPERTSYALTAAGRAELKDWVRELLAVPEPEGSRLEAALSVVGALPPDETMTLLDARVRALDEDAAALRSTLEDGAEQGVARIFMIEVEYALAMRRAEAAWVRSLLEELRTGALPGVAEWRAYHERGDLPDDVAAQWAALAEEGGRRAD